MNGEYNRIIMKTFVKSLFHIKHIAAFSSSEFIYFTFVVSIWCLYKITQLDLLYPFNIDFISDTLKHNLTLCGRFYCWLTIYLNVHISPLMARATIICRAPICSSLTSINTQQRKRLSKNYIRRFIQKFPRDVWTGISRRITEQNDVIGLVDCGILGNVAYWWWNWNTNKYD